MNKEALESLARFCARQRRAFTPKAWMQRSLLDGKALAVAAMYLSMTGWYGYESELKNVVYRVEASLVSSNEFHRQLNAMQFDLGHFSARVRYEIATQDKRTGETNPSDIA